MAAVTNINDVIEGHVALDVVCVDRLYLNAYVPRLQVGGQVERFCKEHLGMPIASPAVIEKIGNRFRREVRTLLRSCARQAITVPLCSKCTPGREPPWSATLSPNSDCERGLDPTGLKDHRAALARPAAERADLWNDGEGDQRWVMLREPNGSGAGAGVRSPQSDPAAGAPAAR